MQVSVVVPVWNPGPSFRRCIESLLTQTIASDQYEIVLVDDGSSDGTADRLDRLAEQHPDLVRVHHTPASGWPGRPRNVGIDAARGEFVHLVDNDDTLPPYALEAMVAAGVEHGADVVMGRPASDFRGLVHNIYRAPFWCGSLREFPDLTTTLTPHKMFRRAMLVRHDIRFPEGPVPLEDQMFVMAAYLHAERIAVLSDRVYYSYLRRLGSGRNAGDRPIEPARQSQAVEQVLDIVEACTDDIEFRDRLFRRFYRINLLATLSNRTVLDGDEALRDDLIAQVRRVTLERLGPGVTESVGAAHRVQGRLLVQQDLPGLVSLGHEYAAVGMRLTAVRRTWRDGVLHLDVEGGVTLHGDLIRAERVAQGWALPAGLAPAAEPADRLLDDGRDEPDVEVSVVSRAGAASFAAESDLRLAVDDEGAVRVAGRVRIDPLRVLAGRRLDDGVWDLRGRLRFAGWNRACTVRVLDDDTSLPPACVLDDGRVVLVQLVHGALQLDVGQWTTSLAEALAPTVRLRAGDRMLGLEVAVVSRSAVLPRVQLLLQGDDEPATGVIVLDGVLQAASTPAIATAALRLPRRTPAGRYRVWLQLPDGPVDVPAALPWTLDTTGSRPHVEPVEPSST